MKIKFCGADKNVTGSRHLIEVNGVKILLDCGMFQGRRALEFKYNLILPFDAGTVDFMLLSHAHIDHCGALPILVKEGYSGHIISTFATRDLTHHMLRDSAYIQEREAEYLNKKLAKKGVSPIQAIYTLKDAEITLQYFQGVNYEKEIKLTPEIKVTFFDAGHILGSALIFLEIFDKEDNKKKTLLFTGDIGHKNMPILNDPYQITKADYLISESTYGNRVHESIINAEARIKKVINETAGKGGKVIIPAFSLGRTQEIVYALHRLLLKNEIPDIPIYVDSPLSVNVTDVFKIHTECFDEKVKQEFIDNHKNPFGFGRLKYITSVDESKEMNYKKGPYILISASGMCEHGRILHHLKNNIEDPKNSILLVGYMAEHTLGRKILEGQRNIKIFGMPYKMNAKVEKVNAFSAHADRSDLLDYISKIKGLKKIFLVHGEEHVISDFQIALAENNIKQTFIPNFGDEVKF